MYLLRDRDRIEANGHRWNAMRGQNGSRESRVMEDCRVQKDKKQSKWANKSHGQGGQTLNGHCHGLTSGSMSH